MSACEDSGKKDTEFLLLCFFRLPSSLQSLVLSDFLSGLDDTDEDDRIQHMAPDPQTAGNIIFADSHAFFTTDGEIVTLIAGSLYTQSGFQEGSGIDARFEKIKSFVTVNDSMIITADAGNRCLILVDLARQETKHFSGLCGGSNETLTDGDSNTARFSTLTSVQIDQLYNIGQLLVMDDGVTIKWRSVEISTGTVTTVLEDQGVNDALDFVQFPRYQLLSVVILNQEGSNRLDTYNTADGTTMSLPFDVGYSAKSIPIDASMLVGSVPGEDKIYIGNSDTYQICSGAQGDVNADLSSCQLNRPLALLIDNDTLFISVTNGIKRVESKSWQLV